MAIPRRSAEPRCILIIVTQACMLWDYLPGKGPANGAKAGSILQIFATGIPPTATVSVQIADRKDLVPLYAGPAPTVPGVQQVNVAVPNDLAASTTQLIICAVVGGQQYCSSGSALAIQ